MKKSKQRKAKCQVNSIIKYLFIPTANQVFKCLQLQQESSQFKLVISKIAEIKVNNAKVKNLVKE